jgi:hypothetical protein
MATGDDAAYMKLPDPDDALRLAVQRGMLAPSVHNTQPWRFIRRGDRLEIRSDPDRRLSVLDPRGRQMTISCGCALFNVRVSLARSGYDALVKRLPDPDDPELIARVALRGQPGEPLLIADLDAAIDERRTNRRAFADEPVPRDVVWTLVSTAASEGSILLPIAEPAQRAALAQLSRRADEIENADPAYRAELVSWTSADPTRRDGVLAPSVPYSGPEAHRSDTLPIRDFDTYGFGWLPTSSHSGTSQCLLLLGTIEDGPMAWLRAGEALERVWLELTALGLAASPLTQVIEVAETHERLRGELKLQMHPHLLMRVGLAPETIPTRRRVFADVFTEAD